MPTSSTWPQTISPVPRLESITFWHRGRLTASEGFVRRGNLICLGDSTEKRLQDYRIFKCLAYSGRLPGRGCMRSIAD